MKRTLILLSISILILFAGQALGEENLTTLRDVAPEHWAAGAVNDLVKKGITQGYPDGTFRGDRNITRYETAVFLSKLAAIVDTTSQVDVSSLKADIKALKDEIASLKKQPAGDVKGIPVTGSFKARYRIANTITSGTATDESPYRGPRIDYRLKTTLSKDFGDGAGVKINLDTMDAGFGGGSQDFAARLLDLEGNLTLHAGELPINIKTTIGPGPQVYTATQDATFPSEVGTVYMRPRSSLFAQTFLGAIELGTGYTARTISSSGEVDVSQITATLGYTLVDIPLFQMFKIYLTGDKLAVDLLREGKPYDERGKLTLSGSFNENASTSVVLGVSRSVNPNEGYYIGWDLALSDPWETGTYATLRYNRTGQEYIINDLATSEFDIVGLDYFDHVLINDIQDWEIDMTQFLQPTLALKAKADFRFTRRGDYGEDFKDCKTTLEGGLSYNVATNTVIDLLYKTYQVPSNTVDVTTDVTTLTFQYKF